MKAETRIFVICSIFFVLVAPAYWFITDATNDKGPDWTGTTALVMAALLVLMISLYLGFHASQMEDRPEDRRSEEHTSELQSLMRTSYAVFCLKKKKNKKQHHKNTRNKI